MSKNRYILGWVNTRYFYQYKDPLTLVGDAVKIQSSSENMKVARIVVFGVETEGYII